MSDETKLHVVILWEHELRAAARAMKALADMPEDASEDERTAAGQAVFGTCWAALWHLCKDPDGANVTVMACRPDPKRGAKVGRQ